MKLQPTNSITYIVHNKTLAQDPDTRGYNNYFKDTNNTVKNPKPIDQYIITPVGRENSENFDFVVELTNNKTWDDRLDLLLSNNETRPELIKNLQRVLKIRLARAEKQSTIILDSFNHLFKHLNLADFIEVMYCKDNSGNFPLNSFAHYFPKSFISFIGNLLKRNLQENPLIKESEDSGFKRTETQLHILELLSRNNENGFSIWEQLAAKDRLFEMIAAVRTYSDISGDSLYWILSNLNNQFGDTLLHIAAQNGHDLTDVKTAVSKSLPENKDLGLPERTALSSEQWEELLQIKNRNGLTVVDLLTGKEIIKSKL